MPTPPDPSARRCFLFLQGPISPYFAEVAKGLVALGHAVRRINLNLGDKLAWIGAPGPVTDFRGRPAEWPRFIEAFLDREGVTDIFLLGEQRDYHRAAIAAAQARGIAVTVTDFGYFRPDWITLERDGMGGDSHFPRDPAAIAELARGLPPAELEGRFRDHFPRQAFWDVVYHLATILPWPFPHYRSHQLHHPLATYAGIALRLLRRRAERAEGLRAVELAGSNPFWVFAMQMETDFSIRAYSSYDGMVTPLTETVRSFAAHAPPDGQLIVKVHPLDPCLRRWSSRLPAIAEAAGVRRRVHVAHHGPLDLMLEGARGLVTVNSTVGLRAIVLGRPVKALGRAVWDVPGLTHQGPLDGFWSGATPPEPTLRAEFLAALQATTQLRGVFYAPEGRRHAVEETVRRLHEGRVGIAERAAISEISLPRSELQRVHGGTPPV
jgi:capsular polysaccharide export protein